MGKPGRDDRRQQRRRGLRRVLVAMLAGSLPLAGAVLAPAAATVATTTSVTAAANPMAGVAVTLTATVAPIPGGGKVAFRTPAGTIYGCSAVAVSTTSGRARCTTTFSGTGRVTVTARYGGSSGFAASTGSRAITVAARVPAFVGSLGSCTTTTGALVAVDFGPWRAPIARGCGLHPASGLALLTGAGFTTAGDQRDGPTFVCRIGHPAVNSGRQYPTPAQDPCVVTPPTAAYWAYWIAAAGSNTWRFSTLGAASYRPKQGEIDAWVYGGTPIGSSGQRPSFTPNQARAGLPAAGAPVATESASPADPSATPDVAAGARYVATARTPAGDAEGTSLAVDGYVQSFAGFADYGLTIDGAFALAAAGTDDAALRSVAAFVDQRRTDAGGRSVDAWTGYGTRYADGGSIGKEALLAEVTGFDPRAFGGHDLVAALDSLVCSRADAAAGCAAPGNFRYATSTFSQALGVLALVRAGDDSAKVAAAVSYLKAVRHADGSWPSLLPASADSDTDSTAMAAMALALLPRDTSAESAVRGAGSWLAAHQYADGGFAGASGESSNSTGLALQGLQLAGTTYRAQSQRALTFLAARQNADGGFAVAATGPSTSDLRASAQAVSGTVGTPLGTLSRDVSAGSAGADATAAARYLVGLLVNGNHVEFAPDSPNYGGTADVAFALAAAGDQDGPLKAVIDYLAGHVADYADPAGAAPKFPGPYSGAAAKLALVAEVTALSPRSFGGYDLLATLTDHVCAAADSSGACTAPGDFYQAFSTVSQALGVLALARAGVTVPASALYRLLQLQCPDGGFSSELITSGQTCTSDPDTTAYAVQALVLLPAEAAAVTAVRAALTFLGHDQQPDGGYLGTAGENVNTTALATEALLAHGATPADQAVVSALRWLGTRQNPDGGLGISAQSPGSDVSATAQALPAIVGMTLTTLLHPLPSGPGGTPTPTPTGSGTPTSPGPPAPPSSEPAGLAMTGTNAGRWLGYALLLVALGALACLAARRHRPRVLERRSRPRHAM